MLSEFLADLEAGMASARDRGKVADYIPELAKVDPGQFGLSICLADGAQISIGDARTPFSIQSVSKVFTLAIALGRFGDGLWRRVGREPSSNAFNSVVDLELEHGKPRNPFVNAGAIVTTDAVMTGRMPREALAEIIRFVRAAAGVERAVERPVWTITAIEPPAARNGRDSASDPGTLGLDGNSFSPVSPRHRT